MSFGQIVGGIIICLLLIYVCYSLFRLVQSFVKKRRASRSHLDTLSPPLDENLKGGVESDEHTDTDN